MSKTMTILNTKLIIQIQEKYRTCIYFKLYCNQIDRELIEQITEDGDIILKQNLLEHHNYEAANLTMFTFLKKWYGVDYAIKRTLFLDSVDLNKMKLDVY